MSRIKVDRITNRAGTGDPLFPNGISVVGLTSLSNVIAGIATFSNVTIGGTITYEDVTNQDVIGLSTFRAGVNITGGSLSLTSGAVSAGGGVNVTSGNVHVGQGGAGSNNSELKLQAGAATGNDIIAFLNQAGSTRGNITYDTDNNFMMINVNAGEKIRISSTGQLGISTANPRGMLHVQGSQVANVTEISGTAIDCASGNYFTKTITGATAFTFTNIPASGTEYSMTVELDLNGNNGVTWPASVKWPADTAPTITDGKTQLFMFVTVDGGTKWRGGTLVDYTT